MQFCLEADTGRMKGALHLRRPNVSIHVDYMNIYLATSVDGATLSIRLLFTVIVLCVLSTHLFGALYTVFQVLYTFFSSM